MKKLLILLLAVTSFYSCKNDSKKKDTTTESNSETIETAGLTLLKGEYIYYGDAAVLQTKHQVYGVVIDKKMQELEDLAKAYKNSETDMVPVEIRGKVIQKPEEEEGWPYRIEIKEIINVSKPDPIKEDIIIGAER